MCLYRPTERAAYSRRVEAGVDDKKMSEMGGRDREAEDPRSDGGDPPADGAPTGDARTDRAGFHSLKGSLECAEARPRDKNTGVARREVEAGTAAGHRRQAGPPHEVLYAISTRGARPMASTTVQQRVA